MSSYHGHRQCGCPELSVCTETIEKVEEHLQMVLNFYHPLLFVENR